MPSDDYTAVTKGGLKLKGVAGAKVDKKKKKKRPNDSTPRAQAEGSSKEKTDVEDTDQVDADRTKTLDKALAEEDGVVGGERDEDETKHDWSRGKTDAEKRHEERRRKMVSRKRSAL